MEGDKEPETQSGPRIPPTWGFALMLLLHPEHRPALSSVVRMKPGAYTSKSVNKVNIKLGEGAWSLGWGSGEGGFCFLSFLLRDVGLFFGVSSSAAASGDST